MIDKKIKCVHCGQTLVMQTNIQTTVACTCSCGKVALTNGVVTEGAQGTDWVDVSQQLLNG